MLALLIDLKPTAMHESTSIADLARKPACRLVGTHFHREAGKRRPGIMNAATLSDLALGDQGVMQMNLERHATTG
jgi:hypothetical protein